MANLPLPQPFPLPAPPLVPPQPNHNEAVEGENDIASHQGRLRGAHNHNLAEVERECDYFSSN